LNVIHHLIWFGSAEKKFVLLLFLFFSSPSLLLLFFSANVCFLKISTGVSGIFLNTWIKIAHLLLFDFILLTIRKMIKVWLTSWKDADFFKIKSSNSFEELTEKNREKILFFWIIIESLIMVLIQKWNQKVINCGEEISHHHF